MGGDYASMDVEEVSQAKQMIIQSMIEDFDANELVCFACSR